MLFEVFLYIFTFLVLAINIYWYYHQKYQFFSRIGIPGPKPTIFFGNILERFKTNRTVLDLRYGKKYGKVYGWYSGTRPIMEIQDIDMIKQICVKDFYIFNNRSKPRLYHEYWNNNLFVSEGDSWKRQRAITSPTFSSGKLRHMHKMMDECVDKLVKYFNKITENGQAIFKTKQISSGFTVDVIASTSFGTETNANGENGDKSPFLINSMKFFNVNPIIVFISEIFPLFILRLFKIKTFFNLEGFNFLISYTRELIQRRRSDSSLARHDFIQLMMNASIDESDIHTQNYDKLIANADIDEDVTEKKKIYSSHKQVKLTEDELIATSIIFFSAGFETTATTIAHIFLELAKNPDIQNRLSQELDNVLNNYSTKNEEYYDAIINKVPYLDAVVKETLRMYPPLVSLLRRCNIDGYKLNGIPIKKDMRISLSVFAVHHNPEYWPEPEHYNPDRFLPGNEHLRGSQYTFIPFGAGPRNCIGMRFALTEIKICIAQIVRKFFFKKAPDTPDIPKFAKNNLLLNPKEFPLIISKRY